MTAYISLPNYLNTVNARYRLLGQKCTSCGQVQFPPKQSCHQCGTSELEDFQLSGKGEIFTFTIIARGVAPTEFDDLQTMTGEYVVALVKLDEGPIIVGQLTGCNPYEIEIGTKVAAVFRRLYDQEGVVRYSFKFKPV